MQRTFLTLIIATLLGTALPVPGVLATIGTEPDSVRTTRPALKLLDTSPVVVRGLHFQSGERIRLTASIEGVKNARVVRASAAGAFTVGFGKGSRVDRCGGAFVVVAIGARGSKALLKLPSRECAPLRIE